MKVWELIARLSEMQAGADVSVSDMPYGEGWLNDLDDVICEGPDSVFLLGNGVNTKENETI